jgi:1-acyl-sn-glycerol-3-phosphate acyltransferase
VQTSCSRQNVESRQRAISTIIERAQSSLNWPQIFIFPEGTTTNGKVLIRFQTGAFKAGMAVQPVLIKYQRPVITTWTKVNGGLKGFLRSILLLLATPINNISIEFLSVYEPSLQELKQPLIFADNVQQLMARHLGKEATDIYSNMK